MQLYLYAHKICIELFYFYFNYLFAHKSATIIAIKYVKQGKTARLTRALTAALKTTNSNINASSELK